MARLQQQSPQATSTAVAPAVAQSARATTPHRRYVRRRYPLWCYPMLALAVVLSLFDITRWASKNHLAQETPYYAAAIQEQSNQRGNQPAYPYDKAVIEAPIISTFDSKIVIGYK